ncbi:MAG TPA: ATP-binding protein [Smithellaceae bacterium]|nr:ATP-binding protein [Smithellaceae bacterium]
MMDSQTVVLMDEHPHPAQAAGQRFSVVPASLLATDETPYADNFEYLGDLEKEALLMLALSASRSGKTDWPQNDAAACRLYARVGIPAGEMLCENIETELARTRDMIRKRQRASRASGAGLFFPVFCRENLLDDFEQKILLLLFLHATSEIFRAAFCLCNFDNDKRGISIRVLLSILCPEYKEQLEKRRYFSRGATLVAREILFFKRDYEKRSSHVIDEIVSINERHVRCMTGDKSLYNSTFSEISIENSAIQLETVVMPDSVKKPLVEHVARYLRQREQAEVSRLDAFLEYGTALTLFFQGPSGTGKTMMARALAHHFQRPLVTVNLSETPYRWQLESIMIQAFQEAALLRGIIFFDEADDIFKDGSFLSRSLLIQIEKARCVIIFATNKSGNIDPAMERRLSMKIHFPLPDAEQRLKIWRALLPDFIALAPDVDLDTLNNRYPFSGGLIKNTLFLAVNMAEPDKSGHLVITGQMLAQAADLQTRQILQNNKFCRMYVPEKRIDNLPLGMVQRRELKNMANAFQHARTHESGLCLLISGTNVETGVYVAEALSEAAGLKVKAFNFGDMDTFVKDQEITDTVSQEKVSLLDHAFCRTTEEAHLLLIVDQNGVMDWKDTRHQNDMDMKLAARNVVTELLNHLRNYRGICCLVIHECPQTSLPAEFHAHFRLDYPPEEMQIQEWAKHLLPDDSSNDALAELVAHHPMHLAEIESLAYRASIQSLMEGKPAQPSLKTAMTVIERYRGKNKTPVLFGK